MKKYLPFLIIALGLVVLVAVIMASRRGRQKTLDERITLKHQDYIPYGTSAARQLLPSIFPQASITYNKDYMSFRDVVNSSDSNQAVVFITRDFEADDEELSQLLSFARAGNYVYIIAQGFSYDAIQHFGFSYYESTLNALVTGNDDSLRVKLEAPAFANTNTYIYPGRSYDSYFYKLDTARTRVLGRNDRDHPNFVQFSAGNGKIFVHSAPLAFSNYFVLHKNNVRYFENALSAIPQSVDRILWSEYYLNRRPNQNEGEPNWLRVLMRYPAFKWALLTGLGLIILGVLLGMRRRQRMIPPYQKPRNESLDFVKTIGRLYYDKHDHRNLARKMGTYFLDHIRSTYKLSTQVLDEEFVDHLHRKSGYQKDELRQIVGFIAALEAMPTITEGELFQFHKKVESFYQNT
jgi:hypothetical protein